MIWLDLCGYKSWIFVRMRYENIRKDNLGIRYNLSLNKKIDFNLYFYILK